MPFRFRSSTLRLAFHFLMLAALPGCIDACSPPVESVPVGRPLPRPEECRDNGCWNNIDCGAGAVCTKDEGATVDDPGCCVQILCTVDADCASGERCVPEVGICQEPAACVPGTSTGCADDETCVGGGALPVCVDTSTLDVAFACHIEPPRVVVNATSAVTFRVLASDAEGAPIFTTDASFVSDVGAVTPDARSALFKSSSCAEPPCRGTVTATTGGATCTADVVVLGAVGPDTLRVSVADLTSRAPLVDVDVVVRRTDGDELVTARTDGDGVVVFGDLASDVVAAVSVFPADHGWQTIVEPGTADVAMFVESLAGGAVTAVKGDADLSAVPSQGDIKLSYVGIAPRVPLFDVDFRLLFGPLVLRTVHIEGVTEAPEDVPFPSGQTFLLGLTPLKPRFLALGRSFENTVFAFAGRVRLADVGGYFTALTETGSDNDGFRMDRWVTEMMRVFAHQVVGDFAPSSIALPADFASPDFDDAALAVPDVTVAPAMPNHFMVDLDVPLLPCDAAGEVECSQESRKRGALVLVSTSVPGRGLVPLGMHTVLDDDDDVGSFDGRLGGVVGSAGIVNPDLGRITLYSRAPHSGLEALPITFAVVARNHGVLFSNDDAPMSVLLQTTATLPDDVGFASDGFLPTPAGTLDDDGVVIPIVTADARSELVRVRLVGNDGAMWDILMPSARALALGDLRPDDVTGRDAMGHVVAARLSGALDAPSSYAALVGRTGKDLDRTDEYVAAWARAPLERP